MDEPSDKPSENSRYNEAGLQIYRLHELWVKIESSIMKGQFTTWSHLLDGVWRELVADANRKPEKERDKIISDNNQSKKKVLSCRTRAKIYEALNERHEFLKVLQDKVGKGGSYIDTSEREFE